MPSQVYNIIRKEESIEVEKNDICIYSFLLKDKVINLANLYEAMNIDIDDVYCMKSGLHKVENPQKDSEKIFNNTYDFMYYLLSSLGKKITELKNKQDEEKCI